MSKMIPNSEAALPEATLPFLDVEMFREPAREGAGRGLFDTFPLDDGKAALVVGDAIGEGPAPIYTDEVKNVLRTRLRECPYPARALSFLNDYLCDAACLGGDGGPGRMTLSLAVVDPVWGECAFAVAGADRPILLHAGGDVEIVGAKGPVIGSVPGFAYRVETRHLGTGDTLLMATDALLGERDICLLVAHRQ